MKRGREDTLPSALREQKRKTEPRAPGFCETHSCLLSDITARQIQYMDIRHLGTCNLRKRRHQDSPLIASLLSLSAQGNASALSQLGTYYLTGNGVEQNHEQAIACFRQAAEAGDATAQYNLARSYEQGTDGLPENPAKAAHYYAQAAGQGHVSAMVNLGVCYLYGTGVAVNAKRAVQLFEQVLALPGLPLRPDRSPSPDELSLYSAARCLIQYADFPPTPRAYALFNLGIYYQQQADLKTAWQYFIKATDYDYTPAQHALSKYLLEMGVGQNQAHGLALLTKAAARGYALALLDLGKQREQQGEVAEAARLFARAAMPQWIPDLVTCEDLDAATILDKAIHFKGNNTAKFNLAYCYQQGRGVAPNLTVALHLYTLAASSPSVEEGSVLAQTNLCLLAQHCAEQVTQIASPHTLQVIHQSRLRLGKK